MYNSIRNRKSFEQLFRGEEEPTPVLLERHEPVARVERDRFVVDRVHDDNLESDIGTQSRETLHRVHEQLAADSQTLPVLVNRQPREQHSWDRIGPVPCLEVLRLFISFNPVGGRGVETDDLPSIRDNAEESPSFVRSLALP